jgi:hypothetical protein
VASTGAAGAGGARRTHALRVQVASLDFAPCAGFEPLRPMRRKPSAPMPTVAMQDSLARLVAAGVVMRSGRAAPEVLQVAVDTASQQGWRRPLAAWLGAQLRLAEQAGATVEAERLRRRLALVDGGR